MNHHFRTIPNLHWLVVLTVLKNISQWEGLSHILWKIKMLETTNQFKKITLQFFCWLGEYIHFLANEFHLKGWTENVRYIKIKSNLYT